MFEAADDSVGYPIDIESSVDVNGGHVKDLEKLADQAGVPTGNKLPEFDQSNESHCTWEDDLKNHDNKQGG